MYKYDREQLKFVKVRQPVVILSIIVVFTILMIFSISMFTKLETRKIEQEAKVIVAKQYEFSVEKLIKLLKDLNFPFPHIVLAQAMHETNFFTSSVYLENHNLFGMKMATVRITTSKAINRDHAVYNTWIDSVYDRALYSATYLSNVKTEDDYYDFLSQYYAEDKEYVNKLKQIIKDKDLLNRMK